MTTLLYAFACVVIPAAWGVASYYLFGFIERRRRRRDDGHDVPPVDYSI